MSNCKLESGATILIILSTYTLEPCCKYVLGLDPEEWVQSSFPSIEEANVWGKINSCQSYPHSSCHGAAPIKAGDFRQSRGAEHFLRMIDSRKPLLEISKIFSHQSGDLSVTQRTGMIKKTKCDPQTVVTLFHIWNKVTTYMLLWIGDRQKISGLPLSTMTKSTCINLYRLPKVFRTILPRETKRNSLVMRNQIVPEEDSWQHPSLVSQCGSDLLVSWLCL